LYGKKSKLAEYFYKVEDFKKLCNMQIKFSSNFAESPKQEVEND